jgi:REP element-mobilizing transposase RayT
MFDLNPGRRQPYRFEDHRYEQPWQPVFFSGTTHHRRPLLLAGDAPQVLTTTLLESADKYRSAVIAYCIMPDHLHYLSCVVEEGGNVRKMADWLQRISGHRIASLGFSTPIWQRSYWDRHVRRNEKTSDVVAYILDNPVADGLCASREDWACSAFLGYPWDAIDEDDGQNG